MTTSTFIEDWWKTERKRENVQRVSFPLVRSFIHWKSMLIRTLSKALSNNSSSSNDSSSSPLTSRHSTLNALSSRLSDSTKILFDQIPQEQWTRFRKRATSLIPSSFDRRDSSTGVGETKNKSIDIEMKRQWRWRFSFFFVATETSETRKDGRKEMSKNLFHRFRSSMSRKFTDESMLHKQITLI